MQHFYYISTDEELGEVRWRLLKLVMEVDLLALPSFSEAQTHISASMGGKKDIHTEPSFVSCACLQRPWRRKTCTNRRHNYEVVVNDTLSTAGLYVDRSLQLTYGTLAGCQSNPDNYAFRTTRERSISRDSNKIWWLLFSHFVDIHYVSLDGHPFVSSQILFSPLDQQLLDNNSMMEHGAAQWENYATKESLLNGEPRTFWEVLQENCSKLYSTLF